MTALPEAVLAWGVDAVFPSGEAEESLVAWLRAHREGEAPRGVVPPLELGDPRPLSPLRRVPGIVRPHRAAAGMRGGLPLLPDPAPSHARVRERSVANVLHHLEALRRGRGRRALFLASDALSYGAERGQGANLPFLEDFLERLARTGLNVSFGYFPSEISPRTLARTPDAARLLRRFVSNRELVIGAQSGSARTLGLMRRPHSLEEAEAAAGVARAAGFVPLVDILLGIPGEGLEGRMETVAWMERLRAGCGACFNMHVFMPLPGTPFAGRDPEAVEPEVRAALRSLQDQGALQGWRGEARLPARGSSSSPPGGMTVHRTR